jgi:hypothetical protein
MHAHNDKGHRKIIGKLGWPFVRKREALHGYPNTAGDCFRQVVLIGTADVPPEFGSIPMRVGVGALKVGTRPAASSSFTNERTVAEKIYPVQIYFWVPLPGGCWRKCQQRQTAEKIYPLPPLLNFAHRVCGTQCIWGGTPTLYVLGGGVLVYQGFLFLYGSPREFFSIREV